MKASRSRGLDRVYYGWRFLTLPERSRPMTIDFLNAVIGCLFFGVWLIVGHIIAVDYI